MKTHLSDLSLRMDTLTIFRGFLSDPVISKLKSLLWLSERGEDMQQALSVYGDFVSSLYQSTSNISQYICSLLEEDENFYIRQVASGAQLSPTVNASLEAELGLLQELSNLSSDQVANALGYRGFLPGWDKDPSLDLSAKYKERLTKLSTHGYGIFAKYTSFIVEDHRLEPVKYPDSQTLEDLYGYQREKSAIISNTEALLSGQKANNVLLYGDAGTGKSSTIKALVNKYSHQGLRLVEFRKNTLMDMSTIVEQLSSNPLKFILFIDDLSFNRNDDSFSSLKAILEGSVSVPGKNMAIYATSNRRHLVKESMSHREGDDLHLYDTLQETSSLSARFGLTVTFQKPDKDQYLQIVDYLAKQYGLDDILKDPARLEAFHNKAEAHAIRTNGRTPRTAKQFVELSKIGI